MKRSIRTGFRLTAGTLVVLILWSGTEAWAYESGPVKDGATVRGIVTVSGSVPAPKEFELRRYPDHEYCSRLSDGHGYRRLREVAFMSDGSLKDVVVVVEGVERLRQGSRVELKGPPGNSRKGK